MSRYPKFPLSKTYIPTLFVGIYSPFAASLFQNRDFSPLVLTLAAVSLVSITVLLKIFIKRMREERWYRLCLERSGDAFLMIDRKGGVRKLNPAAENITSSELDCLRNCVSSNKPLSGNSFFSEASNSWEDAVSRNVNLAAQYCRDEEGSLLVVCKRPPAPDSSSFNTLRTIESRVNERTLELQGLNAVLERKIIEKIKADEALRRTKENYELIFHSVPAMIWYKDAHNRIIRANRWAAESIGRTVEELEGMSTFDLYPEDATQYYEDDLQVIRTGKPKIGIVEQYQPFSGPKLWVRTDKIPYIDSNGVTGGVIVFSVDITESKNAEAKQLEYSDKLKNMNEEMNKFNYLVSHDLQEPLRTIFGFSDLLLKAEDREISRDYASRIREASARIREQLKDLLNYAKSHSEGENLFQEVNLERVLRDVTLDLSRLMEETNARLTIESLPLVYGNASQLYHLFLNLLTNAIKFRRDGYFPEITISTEISHGALEVIKMKDNGIGFDQRHAERIFAPFQKLHSREKYPGSGMGLSLCRKIIQQHGGSLTATGSPNEGAVFEIRLPKSAGGRLSLGEAISGPA